MEAQQPTPVGTERPSQEALSDPKLFLPHPAQYKVVGRRGDRVTVRNTGSGKIVTLDLTSEVGRMALADIERWKGINQRRRQAQGRGVFCPPTKTLEEAKAEAGVVEDPEGLSASTPSADEPAPSPASPSTPPPGDGSRPCS